MSVKTYILRLYGEVGFREYTLGDPSYTIGRNKKCQIIIPETYRYVSSCQCTLVLMPTDISYQDYQYILIDGALQGKRSTNGTWIQRKSSQSNFRIQQQDKPYILQNGDTISFASVHMIPYLIFIVDEGRLNEEGRTIPGHTFSEIE